MSTLNEASTRDPHWMPAAPQGYVACRTSRPGGQITHLVALDERGNNGGRPTMCGLTRFDSRDEHGDRIPGTAGLLGWDLGGGHSGPGVEQDTCPECYSLTEAQGVTR